MTHSPAKPLRVGVLASGRGSNLQALIDSASATSGDYIVATVLSDKKESYALERARLAGIEAVHLDPKSVKDRAEYDLLLASELKKRNVELVCLAGFMRIIGPGFIREFPQRIINIHPALLPSFPGLHAQKQAFDHGVKIAGCTVHFVDEGVDTGPIIIQAAVEALDSDTPETLAERILGQEHAVYPLAVRGIARGLVTVENAGRRVKFDRSKL